MSGFDPTQEIEQVWRRALERTEQDPQGAVTLARTLLEYVRKHILDDMKIAYNQKEGPDRLPNSIVKNLEIGPTQGYSQIFSRLMEKCIDVVSGLSGLRNELGDAHGKGEAIVKPDSIHANLALNLAGSVSIFLVDTWKRSNVVSHE